MMNLFWGVFVPASIMLVSVVLTCWLYRMFSQTPPPTASRHPPGKAEESAVHEEHQD
jgi:hypothetical protein